MNLQEHKNIDNYSNQSLGSKTNSTIESKSAVTFHYHPNDIDFTTTHLSVGKIIKRLKDKEIDILPEKRDWASIKQSRFIESILVRIPLPSFYFDGNDDKNWQVVDGLKRLKTLNNFVLNQKRLENLEYLPTYNGMTFRSLPRDLQRRIEETTIISYILNSGVPTDFKHSIFKRINPQRYT